MSPPMDDWEPRLADLDKRLVLWNRRFEEELSRVLGERGLVGLRALFRRPSAADRQAAVVEARRRAGVEILAELAELLDALCDRYPTVLPQERATIRARVGSHEAVFDLFWGYVESLPERISAGAGAPLARRAFCAVAIDDMRAELHLVDDALRRIVLAAAAAGIEWRPILSEVAQVANKGAGGGGACMREYLEEFEKSIFFRDHVAAELREAGKRALQSR